MKAKGQSVTMSALTKILLGTVMISVLSACGSGSSGPVTSLPVQSGPSTTSAGVFALDETVSVRLAGEVRVDVSSPEELPATLVIQGATFLRADLEIVPGYVSYVASLDSFTTPLDPFAEVEIPGVSEATINVVVLTEAANATEGVSLLYEGNPDDVTLNDVLILFAAGGLPGADEQQIIDQANAFGAFPEITALDPAPNPPVNTDWNADGAFDIADIAVIQAAFNIPGPPGTEDPADLASLSNTLLTGSGITVDPASIAIIPGSGTLPGDSTVPLVTVGATDASEPDVAGEFTITRTGDLAGDLTVTYTVPLTGTATPAVDYDDSTATGTVTIADTEATATVVITPIDDADVEGDETVILTLEDGADYDLGATPEATLTIADDDDVPVIPEVRIQTVLDEGAESPGDEFPVSFRFIADEAPTSDLVINFSVTGSADPAADVTDDPAGALAAGQITIPATETNVVLTLTPVDDTEVEGTEDITLTIEPDAAYTIDEFSDSDTATINDNDGGEVILLNEIKVAGSPFVELKGSSFGPLTFQSGNNAALVAVDGVTNPGEVLYFADLSTAVNPVDGMNTLGGNGILTIREPLAYEAAPVASPDTTRVDDANVANIPAVGTFFLIEVAPGTDVPLGTDFDTDDDGVPESLPPGVDILDAVALSDGGDVPYSATILNFTGLLEGATRPLESNDPGAGAEAAWYFGDLASADDEEVIYNTTATTAGAEVPDNAQLTPLASNQPPVPTLAQDQLLIASGDTDKIVRFNFTGSAYEFADIFAEGSGLARPAGLEFSGDPAAPEFLFVTNSDTDQLVRFRGDGSGFDGVVTSIFGANPSGMTFDGSGNLYVALEDLDQVAQFDPATGLLLDGDFLTPTNLDGPRRILFGPDGRFYVNSFNNDFTLSYDNTGADEQPVLNFDTLPLPDAQLVRPAGSVFANVGGTDFYYVAGFNSNQIYRFDITDPEGTVTTVVDNLDPTTGGALDPDGLDEPGAMRIGPSFDGDGTDDLYVASRENNRVLVYDIDDITGDLIPLGPAFDPASVSTADLSDPRAIIFIRAGQ